MILSKYCASGNDFLIFHTFEHKNRSEYAKKMCNRFYGIGADGLVVLLPYAQNSDEKGDEEAISELDSKQIAYQWEFYNSDGSIANMCGNASRAVTLYAYHNNIAGLKHNFLSKVGVIENNIQNIKSDKEALVQSNLGKFSFEGSFVESRRENLYDFELIVVGIPHLVCKCESLREFDGLLDDLEFLSQLRHKHNANVSIAFRENDVIHYATFERGVEGITQACGTGACAVFASFREFDKSYTLIPPSKERLIVSSKNSEIYFAGLVSLVATCVV
ncbi:diaminopimelate epimerase [Helicobacter saguini]|uniref:Diaminopimelate epimerase n=1 Tax=Helicobacter saguini TaxID=1548018 RepID=A0A4U8SYS1_9HELI|nr:diaminopimelate epimerase [Helicobacter saguini]MWV66604.1 diaminopimelate epimerase [Helicobacter saguini]TLD92195.1 diaminopimelate epimerase [Helicobacter saguini]